MDALLTPARDELPLAAWARAVRPSAIGAMMQAMARPGVISFALGLPAPELFPVEDYARAAERVLRSDRGALQYRAALAPLRAQVAELMAQRGVLCRPEQVFLTTGAQQALALFARMFLEPGGTVLCEKLVYMGFRQVLEPFSPRILAVDSSLETGIDVDQVEALLESGERPAFIYLVTDGHNPLGVSVSVDKRVRLAELAREHRVPVIEDDAYGLLALETPRLPLRALEDRWVLYVGSFSKVLAPGFRVGWTVVPEELVTALACAKDGHDIDSATFTQSLVSAYLDQGGFPAHVAAARAAYRRKRDRMIAGIAAHFPAGTRWSVPRNGALLWAELPHGYDTGALLPLVLETEGVAYVPGSVFAAHDSGAGARGMRLNFSFPSLEQIDEGIARLGRVFRSV
jgi:2-aminoadipate transaminase